MNKANKLHREFVGKLLELDESELISEIMLETGEHLEYTYSEFEHHLFLMSAYAAGARINYCDMPVRYPNFLDISNNLSAAEEIVNINGRPCLGPIRKKPEIGQIVWTRGRILFDGETIKSEIDYHIWEANERDLCGLKSGLLFDTKEKARAAFAAMDALLLPKSEAKANEQD